METPMETRAESPQSVIKRVAGLYGVSVEDLLGPSQRPWLTKARQDAARALAAQGMPRVEIGRFLHKHYSSVVYWLRAS